MPGTKTHVAAMVQDNRTVQAVCTAAVGSINTDAPTNAVLLGQAGPNDSMLTRLTALPRATPTATVLYLFVSKDGGTTKRLIGRAKMGAATVSTTDFPEPTDFGFNESNGYRFEAGDELYVGISVAITAGIVFAGQLSDF